MPRLLKTVRSHAGHARLLAELDSDDEGVAIVVRVIPRLLGIPSPYFYSGEWDVYRHQGRDVIVRETAHRRYEMYDVSDVASIEEPGSEGGAP